MRLQESPRVLTNETKPSGGIVLFVCVENACRSLMAEAMFNAAGTSGWRAISAGSRPAAQPNPRTAAMLRELGLEIPLHPPQLLTPETTKAAKIRITMGCLEDASCPSFLKTLESRDWGIPDPSSLDDAGFRRVRDDLVRRVEGLVRELALSDRLTAARQQGRSA